ncbi:MAG TPA: hypothetical protein VK364_08075, partial [Hymenobacter sp.]|nr:hypothetical protein [Hymenobacter sp.]
MPNPSVDHAKLLTKEYARLFSPDHLAVESFKLPTGEEASQVHCGRILSNQSVWPKTENWSSTSRNKAAKTN